MGDDFTTQPEENNRLSPEVVGRIVADATRHYFDSRRSRVDAFVDRHFSLAGSATIHRKAVGWDMLKALANIMLAVPQLTRRLAAAEAKAVGAKRTAEYLGSRKLLFDTAVGQEIEWLIMTEFSELPFQQDERGSRKDALVETILSAPEIQETLSTTLLAVGRRGGDPAFRQRLEESTTTYAETRAATAEITTALMTVGAGAITVKHTTPGVMTLGPALAAALAQQAAIASFPLGASLGTLWYGFFPAAASPVLISGVTGGLLAANSIAAAFAGIVVDPIQRRVGLHHRRLLRLIDA